MQQDQIVADAIAIVDLALADLEAAGCSPIDRAAALVSVGLAELDDSDDLAGALAVYQTVLEHTVAALRELQAKAGGPSGTVLH